MKIVYIFIAILLWPLSHTTSKDLQRDNIYQKTVAFLKPLIMAEAAWAMQQEPVTVTAYKCERSAGGTHDFYSEGDYWWPDPKNPNGPYIQRDGLSNPQNFVAHRLAMIRFSNVIGALSSAYKLTHNKKYLTQAMKHLNAWFVNCSTKMNPNLQYAQAISGVATGRGIGIIDTIQLMEVAQGAEVFEGAGFDDTIEQVKKWFAQYLFWLNHHPYGLAEKSAKNNHGTCWVMQVACFAKFVGDQPMMDSCRIRYKMVLLPTQMAKDGSFPLELQRTKPYGYSIFNLDAMVAICQMLSNKTDNLWNYETPNGRSIKTGINFLYPYLKDKILWPYAQDVMHWEDWPVAGPTLIFGANAYNNNDWFATWRTLDHQPKNEEIIRNLPVRHPLIWL